MKSPDNPYHAGRTSIADGNSSLQRKRLHPIEIVVSLTIIGSIFTLLSPSLYSGKHAGPTPEWIKTYVAPLSAPLFQKIACTILVIAFGFMAITVVLAWMRTRSSVAMKSSGVAPNHDAAIVNPYASPSETSIPLIAKLGDRWPLRTRLRLFVGFAVASLLLNFGFFHAPFVLYWGDLQPVGFEIAHRYLITIVGIGLPIQCLLSATAFNRRMAFVIVFCNCVVLAIQLFYVYELIRAVAAGP